MQNRQKSRSFGWLFWSIWGKNEEAYDPKITFPLMSSSSTTNPMQNTAMFRRTTFFRFKGLDLCKIGKNRTVLADSFEAHGGKSKRPIIQKPHSLWCVVAVLPIPCRIQQCFVGPLFSFQRSDLCKIGKNRTVLAIHLKHTGGKRRGLRSKNHIPFDE